MGGALSSNTANAVTDVTNEVSTRVGQDSNVNNTCKTKVSLKYCKIFAGRDYNQDNFCKNVATISQYQKSTIQSNLNNMIAQQMTQQASSVVGALGVGIADANNTANAFVGASTKITNSINQTATSYNFSDNEFYCTGSSVKAGRDINIKQMTENNYVSNQVLDAGVSNRIVNDIKQSISQTASAKVEGLTGLILALAFLVIAIGVMFAAPVKAVFSSKYLMITIIIVVILIIVVVMYLRKSWPFFNDIPYITLNDSCTAGDLVDVQDKTINLDTAPTRYHFPLWDSKKEAVSLLMMGVAGKTTFKDLNKQPNDDAELKKKSAEDINKYIGDINKDIKKFCETRNITPSFNIEKFTPDDSSTEDYYDQFQNQITEQFSGTGNEEHLKILRYVICNGINSTIPATPFFDLNIKIDGDYTKIIDTDKKDNKDKIYTFTPKSVDIKNWDCIEGLSGGTIKGKFGVCPTNSYKFQKFMRKGGFAILILMVLFPIIYLLVLKPKKGDVKKK